MNPIIIDSADDSRLDPFRNIKGQTRRHDDTFVAESELVLERLFSSHFVVRSILLTAARAERLHGDLRAYVDAQSASTKIFIAHQSIIDAVVGYPLHRGVISVVERPTLPSAQSVLQRSQTLVVLEQVMDPENVGTVFRHCAGFGVDGVLLHGPTGDPLYRKTIRTSMGWTLAIPYARTTDGSSLPELLRAHGFVTLALTPASGSQLLSEAVGMLDSSARIALLLGAEGPGLTAETLAAVDHCVRIPMNDGVDSLNVATAAAVALYALTCAQPSRLKRVHRPA
jgi:tRNA G18 (ribose-2'-O)-methylase SpoU